MLLEATTVLMNAGDIYMGLRLKDATLIIIMKEDSRDCFKLDIYMIFIYYLYYMFVEYHIQ